MTKIVLLIAFVGHVLCGICDCLLSYSPSGRLDLKGALKDPEKMRTEFSDLPLRWPLISIMLGVYAITAFGFGYFALCKWMEQFSGMASTIMYLSTVIFLISIVVHHIICGLVEWLYIRLGRSDEAREAVLEFQMQRLMPENRHGRHRSDAAAEEREKQQDLFRNAPHAPLGAQLVPAIDGKGDSCDDKQIDG